MPPHARARGRGHLAIGVWCLQSYLRGRRRISIFLTSEACSGVQASKAPSPADRYGKHGEFL